MAVVQEAKFSASKRRRRNAFITKNVTHMNTKLSAATQIM
jgi:ribosomal protein L32